MTAKIRAAAPGDEQIIFSLIEALADYERLLGELEVTPRTISEALFGANARVFCDLAESDGEIVGFALWFYNYSTFRGRHGIYLEDLFVRPQWRDRGIGKALLGHLARRCIDENLGRLEWMVLDWNQPAIAFYQSRGARLLDDWTTCRVDRADLRALAISDNST